MFNTSLAGKRICITGITGFIGRHLARALEERGATVYGISRTANAHRSLLRASIEDTPRICAFLSEHAITQCVHLAGVSTVGAGQAVPRDTFSVNVVGTASILECARAVSLERIVMASTVHVYGRRPPPYKETDALDASRPYETSKVCADLLAQSYAHTYDLPVLIPRFVNTYGPGDPHRERLIPWAIETISRGETLRLWGEDIQREYLYIDDVIEAYLRLLTVPRESFSEHPVVNIGTAAPVTTRTVVETISRLMGVNVQILPAPEARAGEIPRQHTVIERANSLLDWQPKISLEAGLARTIEQDRALVREPLSVRPMVAR